MNNYDLIIIDKDISAGSPIIKGRRLTVFNVVTKIFYEEDLETALEDYEISLETAKQSTSYCKELKCQQDSRLIKFCDGCILRTLQDGWEFKKKDYSNLLENKSLHNLTFSKDGKNIFFGNIDELENKRFGKLGWMIAAEDQKKYSILIE